MQTRRHGYFESLIFSLVETVIILEFAVKILKNYEGICSMTHNE